MSTLVSAIQTAAIFVAGLVVRFGLLFAVLAFLAIIFLVGLAFVRFGAAVRRKIVGESTADGVRWKRDGYYSSGHLWLVAKGAKELRMGFDDLAQRVLGRTTAIDLPKPGTALKEGELLAVVTCGDRKVRVPSPVSGKIVALNDSTLLEPSAIHRDPYGRGWLMAIEPANTAYTRFFWGSAARGWLHEEAARLRRALEQDLQLHAADGGELMAPGACLLEDQQWERLVKTFLKAID